jgi:endo-1,3(4)-beta-glucanase
MVDIRAAAISTAAPGYTSGTSYQPVDSTLTTLSGPFPTNAWFLNFMVGTGAQPVNVFPYEVRALASGLDVCSPVINAAAGNAALAVMLQNISLQSTDTTTSRKLTGFTDLGATLTWTGAGGTMVADIVRGMAYATMRYTGLTPKLVSAHAITAINGTSVGATGTFTGAKFKLAMNNGQTWIVYTSSSVTFTLSTANTLTAGAAFTGTVRAAVVGASEATLDASAAMIPTGGTVAASVTGDTATETWTWATTGTGSLLSYALQHHLPRLSGVTQPGGTLSTLRGTMTAVVGSTWTLTFTLPTIGWNNANPIDPARQSVVATALAGDQGFVPNVGDPYFGGKQLAKAGRLALIADQLGNTAARDTLLGNLKTALGNYLSGALATRLRYDTAWGGIVSEAGLGTDQADFGNGRYNDHHFHYGYTIFAAGVVARYDSAWAATWRTKVNDLVRDIANPVAADTYFTPFRHFDWFEGHSWASGNYEFGDNRNQESSSEAVNAWYGVHLWGLATGQTQIRDLGRLLLGEEITAARTYYQIKQSDTTYPAAFRTNGVVGVLWSNKVDYATFFGGQAEYIHGIQMLPITPATEALIDPAWISEDWTRVLSGLWTRTSVWRAELVSGGSGYVPANGSGFPHTDGLAASGGTGTGLVFNCNISGGQIVEAFIVFNQHGTGYTEGDIVSINGSGGTGATVRVHTQPEDGWKAVLLGGLAVSDPDTAWTMTNALTGWDDGSSKTQALYHIATQTAGSSVTASGTVGVTVTGTSTATGTVDVAVVTGGSSTASGSVSLVVNPSTPTFYRLKAGQWVAVQLWHRAAGVWKRIA